MSQLKIVQNSDGTMRVTERRSEKAVSETIQMKLDWFDGGLLIW